MSRRSESDLKQLLSLAHSLFGRLFPNEELGLIVGPFRLISTGDVVRAVLLRAGQNAEHEVISLREVNAPITRLTATDLTQPEPLARITIRPAEGLPIIEPIPLLAKEAQVLGILIEERGPLLGREIAPKLGYRPGDSRPRDLLSRMRKKRLLDSNEGYLPTLRGKLSYEEWRRNQMFEDEE